MKKVGNYKSAEHKFQQALKLEPKNTTAIYEMQMIKRIIHLDGQITLAHLENYTLFQPVISGGFMQKEMLNESKQKQMDYVLKKDKWMCQTVCEQVCPIF